MTAFPPPSDPHAAPPLSFRAMVATPIRHRELIDRLVRREVSARYLGSVLGLSWSLLQPLLLLGVYTLLFSVIFPSRWDPQTRGNLPVALLIFSGLIVHAVFSESLARAPTLVTAHANLVRRSAFPLEILPVVALGTAAFHAAASLVILVLAVLFVRGGLPPSACTLPLVLLPLGPLTLGVTWFLAALGVFLRDLGPSIGLVTTLLLFLSPVFYPAEAAPAAIRTLIQLNPLTFVIGQARAVLLFGHWPDWTGLLAYAGVALAISWAGFACFQRTRRGFADVL